MTLQAFPEDVKRKFINAAIRNQISLENLVQRNQVLSSLAWEVIRIFELNFRSHLHRLLSVRLEEIKWWQNPNLIYKEHLIRSPKGDNPYEVINLGFLSLIFSDRYHNKLWVRHLSQAFPNWSLGRRELHASLKKLVEIRNRIAHHEIIYNYPIVETVEFARKILLDINKNAAIEIERNKYVEKIKKIKLGSGGGI